MATAAHATDADADAPPRPVARPPARRRLVRRRPPDHGRPLHVLSLLALYVFVIHYSLRLLAFYLPDEAPSREEMLAARGSTGVSGPE